MIEIKEKSESISWNKIHEVLWEAHSVNRKKNVIMSFASLPGNVLKKKVETGNGKLFVAMDGDKIVGTGAYTIVYSSFWFTKDTYLYMCLIGVLPGYKGNGIYKQLYEVLETEAIKTGNKIIVFETHENNNRMISINQNKGFHVVSYKNVKTDHCNVIMAKWLDGCPYSSTVILYHYLKSKIKVKLRLLMSISRGK